MSMHGIELIVGKAKIFCISESVYRNRITYKTANYCQLHAENVAEKEFFHGSAVLPDFD